MTPSFTAKQNEWDLLFHLVTDSWLLMTLYRHDVSAVTQMGVSSTESVKFSGWNFLQEVTSDVGQIKKDPL
jgi:hypothetical protein